jgi:antitoxin CcdA
MPDTNISATNARRATNVTLPEALVSMARALGVNISQASEAGLAAAVKKAREQKWLEENKEAIEEYNKYVEEHGLTLEEYRTF